MTTNIAKIRAALEQAGEYIRSDLASERGAFEGYEGVSRIDEIKADLKSNASALAALTELEKSAAEPVAWIIGKPTHCHEIGRYLAWNAGHVPHSVGSAAEPLYAAPPAPVAEIREVVVVTRPMCHGAWARFWSESNSGDSCDQAMRWLEAWRAELGPTLGLVELKEPTPEECRDIWREAKANEGDGSKVCAGRAMFAACRAVMWPKEGL